MHQALLFLASLLLALAITVLVPGQMGMYLALLFMLVGDASLFVLIVRDLRRRRRH